MLLTLFALSRIIHPNNNRSVNKEAREIETHSACCCGRESFFPHCRAAPVLQTLQLSLSLTLPVLSLYTNSNHSPRLSQGALFRQDVLCERVCVFSIVCRHECGFCNSLGTPSSLDHLIGEGNGELREEKKRRCVTEGKKEPLMKSEVSERENPLS